RDRVPPLQLQELQTRVRESAEAPNDWSSETDTNEAGEDKTVQHGRCEVRLDARNRAARLGDRRRRDLLPPRARPAPAESARLSRRRERSAQGRALRRVCGCAS